MQRWTYYGISGTPYVKIDGIITEVGGVSFPGTMYPHYRHDWITRLAVSSPLEIDLTCSYDSIANSGTVTAVVDNTSGSTVSGDLHFAIVESDIPYNWYGLTTVEHVCRDMLPNGNGESVSIPASDTIIRSRNFNINSGWDEHNCTIVVFVQEATSEIYQGAEVGVMDIIDMDYYGLTFTELSGNGNRVAQPGESIRMCFDGKNNGHGNYTGGAAIISSDPYVSITSSNPQTISIGPGEVDTVIILDVSISSGCPSPYSWDFQLDFGTGDIDDISFIITDQPGFSDDMESGQGDWTHSGGNDNWHITTYKSHSPNSSWYCGNESNHQYSNLVDASLISPYFVVTPDSSLNFWHQYRLEIDYDYSFVEIDNNSGWWYIIDEYNGFQTSWTQAAYSLSDYAGQTVRLRFRFCSDQSVVDEGWYIDDVEVPTIIGIEETKSDLKPITLQVSPNPFCKLLHIQYSATTAQGQVQLKIYDATGRLIKEFPCSTSNTSCPTRIIWDGVDHAGTKVPAGVYFIRLETDNSTLAEKVLLLK